MRFNLTEIFQRAMVSALLAVLILPGWAFSAGPAKAKALTEEQKILHVLNRLTYGPRPGDVERVKAIGISKFIEQQLNAAAIDDSKLDARVGRFDIFGMSTAEIFGKYPNPGALLQQLEGRNRRQQAANGTAAMNEEPTEADRRERQRQLREIYAEYGLRPAGQLLPQIVGNRVVRAAYSERQLEEVMVDFWQNHFNVFAGKAAVRWYIPSYERDVLRKHALGNFRDLLAGTAQHPAMLFFLDNFESVSPNSQQRAGGNGPLQRAIRSGNVPLRLREQIKERQGITDAELDRRIAQARNAGNQMRRGLNENYARELLELHTLGVGGGYTQQDIVEVAKAFTGWTIADPRGYRRAAANMIRGEENRQIERLQRMAGVPDDIESGEFYFNERSHEKGTKTVLGQKIDEGGMKDGLKVLDILVKHPSTAKFIARKLAVKFVRDDPSEAMVGRVAAAFTKSNGDIKATLRALFTDKEFFAPENYRAKIKTPFELAVSTLRALGAETNANPALIGMLNKLGEVPYGYQAPTGYPDTAEDWVNTGALLERLNFAVAVSSNRIPGTRVDLRGYYAASRGEILENAIGKILYDEVSPATRASLEKQAAQPLPEVAAGNEADDLDLGDINMRPAGMPGGGMNRRVRLMQPSGEPEVFKAVSLVLGTPEFQRQ
ncbi:MAG: DUF1800 domain-containing protein [Acidobacteria bacterium]|nr:DUF1800 domain-containing protein [Acidobacteriota bacterium]